MKKQIKLLLFLVTVVVGVVFAFEPVGISRAANCDVIGITFNPSGDQAENWFNRSNVPTFQIRIKGNGSCSNVTLPNISLTQTRTLNNDIEALNDVPITFSDGSNEISLTFSAGEEGCKAGPLFYDCKMRVNVTTSVGSFWSDEVSGGSGGLNYDCDQRFSSIGGFRGCSNDYKFKLLDVRGGVLGGGKTLCAYVAGDGRYACIAGSEGSGSCSSLSQCSGKQCLRIDKSNCGGLSKIWACVAGDNRYACSKDNKSDLSDTPACSGRTPVQVAPNQCGELASGGGGTCNNNGVCDTGETPLNCPSDCTAKPGEDQPFIFKLDNPIEADNFLELIDVLATWLFNLSIPVVVVMIVWSGVMFLTSRGDTTKVTKARQILLYAVVGFAIILIGKGFITLIESILNLGTSP